MVQPGLLQVPRGMVRENLIYFGMSIYIKVYLYIYWAQEGGTGFGFKLQLHAPRLLAPQSFPCGLNSCLLLSTQVWDRVLPQGGGGSHGA